MMTALLLLLAGPVQADELRLYPDRFYRGAPLVLADSAPRISPALQPQSLQRRGRWQLCPDADFKGQCVEPDRDYPVVAGLGLSFKVASARRLDAGSGVADAAPGAAPEGPSLAGHGTRFFASPQFGGERVLACAKDPEGNMDCARDTALDLCRRAGFRAVEYLGLERVNGRLLLADVLCGKVN